MRVFLGMGEVAGYYRGLKQGFEELGVRCTFVDITSHRFQYGGAENGALVRGIRSLLGKPGRLRQLVAHVLRFALLLRVVWSHDVFVFAFGNSILPRNLDLRLLKALRKRVIFQFHGSDSRPPFVDGTVVQDLEPATISTVIARAAEKKMGLVRIGRFADVIVDTPMQGLFHERPFVVWLRIGLPSRPLTVPAKQAGPAPDPGRPVRILHSPSVPAAKGTPAIREAIARVRAKGIAVDLVEIAGRPNSEVLRALSEADFVIDQLYADYAMPGFATEAAWYGKAVIICGYAKDLWDSLLPPEWIPPTHYCRPEELDAAIERFATDAAARHALGLRAREFVETKWAPRAVAERYLRLAKGDVPADWMWDPSRTTYWQGACLPDEKVRSVLRAVIAAGGRAALQLGDKPAVEKVFVDAARSEA